MPERLTVTDGSLPVRGPLGRRYPRRPPEAVAQTATYNAELVSIPIKARVPKGPVNDPLRRCSRLQVASVEVAI
jgi:hypothetical protein